MALTDTEIKRARPADEPYRMADGGNLYLWVTPPGGKLWRWAYRFDGKQKLMTLGKYPDVSLARARERHAQQRTLLAEGIDPMAQKKAEKTAVRLATENSFAGVAGRWLEHWKDDKSPRHVDSTRRRLASNILPSLGSFQIAEIEAPDIVAMVKAVEARGARDVAKRALETTGQIFRYAIAHGYAKRNPATDIRPRDILKASLKLNYARIDAKELPNLLRQIEVYQGTHVTRLAIKLMALTFVRTSELIGAKWTEFDMELARWDIPAERMKMRTPHIVPLARQSLEVLSLLQALTGHSEWLFPGDSARAGVCSRSYRTATCACPAECRERRLQPCPLPGTTHEHDAGLGRLSGKYSARSKGSAIPGSGCMSIGSISA
jgi:integrase